MSYKCDICSFDMPSKSSGIIYKTVDVLLCPSYWNLIASKQKAFADMLGSGAAENGYGMTIQQLINDQSGFSVCEKCSKKLTSCDDQLNGIGLNNLKNSEASQRDKILVVAGVVWQNEFGQWPSCLDNSVKNIYINIKDQSKSTPTPKIKDHLPADQNNVTKKSPQKPWWRFW